MQVVSTWTRDIKLSTLHPTIHCAVTVHREEGRTREREDRGKESERERVDMLYKVHNMIHERSLLPLIAAIPSGKALPSIVCHTIISTVYRKKINK